MANINMVSPWVEYYHQVQAFFKYDDEVNVMFDDEAPEVKIYVTNETKADALTQLLPETKEYGNITLKVTVIPVNVDDKRNYYNPYRGKCGKHTYRTNAAPESSQELFFNAFRGNEAFAFGDVVHLQTNDIIYFVFKNEVVQYYNDDLGDYYGQCSTLFQNLAAEIFKPVDNVHFCTDKPRYNNQY